jgi:hypothetical protein
VSWQIVHDDDVAGPQRRRQHLLDIGEESGAVHWPIQHHRRRQTRQPERTGEGRRLPMAMRHRCPASLAAFRPATQTRHFG